MLPSFMDFNIRKPSHIFSLLLLSVTLILIIVLPVLSFFDASLPSELSQMTQLPDTMKLIFEIFLLTFQLALITVLLIFFPVIWYVLVNKLTLKEVFNRLRLRLEGIDVAFLWGIVSAVVMFGIVFLIGLILVFMDYNVEELSNIPNLQQYFSIPSLFLLIAIQPIAEEIFFRGFLLDKIESLAGKSMAIVTTAVLFGLAHMSYGKIYPVIMPMIMGLILGFVVIKTKNLYSAIIAHVIFNLTAFILSILSQNLVPEALIL